MKTISYLLLFTFLTFSLKSQDFSGSRTYNAANNMTMEVAIDVGNQTVTLTMTGPNNVWFAYGFDNNRMSGTYIILSEGNGNVVERKLSSRGAGSVLSNSFTNSNTVVNGGIRTTTVTRPLQGLTSDHYTFLAQEYSIPVIWAYGNGATIAYHARRGISSMLIEGNCVETQSNISSSNCESYTSPSGKTFTETGNYSDTIPNAAGCDSVINIDLTILNSVSNSITVSSCESYTSDANNEYTSTGSYTETFTGNNGCDSILTINLTILENSTNQFSVSTCKPDYLSPSGKTYTMSGNYTDTLDNAAGCDSIINIDLTLNVQLIDSLEVTACGFYNSPSGQILDSTGVYKDTIPSVAGCDSILVIDLEISEELFTELAIVSCDSVTYKDSVIYNNGNFTDSLIAVNGCDSIVLVNHDVYNSYRFDINTSACNNFRLPSGIEVSESGIYTDTLKSINQCDSIITIDLTINTVNTDIDIDGNNLITEDTLADAYQWLDCDNNFEAIQGENEFSFSPETSGLFAVEISNNNCTDTSDCVNMVIDNITELETAQEPIISQNASEIIVSNLNQSQQIRIVNSLGQIIYSGKASNQEIKLPKPKLGLYILQADGKNGIIRKRFMVQ